MRQRWLVMTDSNCGLGCTLKETAKAIWFAKETSRTLVIHWSKHAFYSDGLEGNAFELYFDGIGEAGIGAVPFSTFAAEDIDPAGFDFWQRVSDNSYYREASETQLTGSDAPVFICSCIKSAIDFHPIDAMTDFYAPLFAQIRIKPGLRRVAADFRASSMGASFIAVHVRGGDKKLEQSTLDDLTGVYFQEIDRALQTGGYQDVFLMTDNSSAAAAFAARFPKIKMFPENIRNDWCLHGHSDPWHMERRYRLALESISDVHMGRTADLFIGNSKSYFTQIIHFWRRNEDLPTVFVDLL